MQRRDWSYKDGYKPQWIIYCTTAIAPMIVEGAEIKPAGARRAPQDHVAVIIPNDQWSPSQQGEEEEEEDDWSEFMPSCQVFSAKSKAYTELDKWQSRPPASLPLQPKPKAKACACAMQTGGTDELSLRPILVFPFPPKIQVFSKVF